jgi:hypothetical protein
MCRLLLGAQPLGARPEPSRCLISDLGPRGFFLLGAWSLELGLGCVCGVWLWLAVCGVRSAECVEYGVCVLSVPTTNNVPNNGITHHASRHRHQHWLFARWLLDMAITALP